MTAIVEERPSYLRKESRSDAEKINGYTNVTVLESDIEARGPEIEEAFAASTSMSREEVNKATEDIVLVHERDPNFPTRVMEMAKHYLQDSIAREQVYEEMKVEVALMKINSPYPEVRAVVSNHDDPCTPASTFRSWFIGLIFVGASAFFNQFFTIRQPNITVGPNVVQLLAYPAGKLFEKVLPSTKFTTMGHTWSLNPGPFNMKEHMVITIMANAGSTAPYSNPIIFVQYLDRFFGMKWASNFNYQILIGLSTNFIGYGLAGLARRLLVYPTQAIWPSTLATIALNRALHTEVNQSANKWKITRMRWFLYCFGAMFAYFWFPNCLFQMLSYFNWITWIAPNNVNLAAITGSIGGLGLNPWPTFDWNMLYSDPLINPFFSTFNFFLGTLSTLPIIAVLWYSNVWNTGYLPINSNNVFSNLGKRYVVARVVDENGLFNSTAYESYSPVYLSAGNIVSYSVFFALYSSMMSHAIIYHRHEIMNGFRNLILRQTLVHSHHDIHSRLMQQYKEVPEWVYFVILVVATVLGAVGLGAYPTQTTPAAVLYGVFLAAIFCVPIGIIQSITNFQITLNVLAEFLGGLWFPGNGEHPPLPMNFFKAYGYVTTSQALALTQDLKLAHYTHIAPWVTLSAQSIATLVSTFVCVGVLNFQMTGVKNVCDPAQKDRFTCPSINTVFTGSVVWGTLGPIKMFGTSAMYNPLLYCFLVGAVLPVIFFYIGRKFPAMRNFHVPVFLLGGLAWAPYNLSYVWPTVPVGFIFNVYLKRRFLPWWSKYNYVTTTAFSSAIAISGILIFFALQYKDIEVDWVGNTLPYSGVDATGPARIEIPEKGYFGPGVGEF